jgi:hypothetical protein
MPLTDFRSIQEPLNDERVKSRCFYIQLKIKDYLSMIDLEANPYQRNLLKVKLYRKLINDILEGALFPTISVVYPNQVNLETGFNTDFKFQILDGLQRTNCLMLCKDIITKEIDEKLFPQNKIKYKNLEDFLNRYITLEVWEDLKLPAILYKIVVLNTGQRRMDTRHQLDILMSSLNNTLIAQGIEIMKVKDKESGGLGSSELYESNIYPLSDIAESLVSYLNGVPSYSPQTAADYLFGLINLGETEFDNLLKAVERPDTYSDLIWVLKDFGTKIYDKYKENIMIKYGIFLNGVMAALGWARENQDSENIIQKQKLLLQSFDSDPDPLNIKSFEEYYKKFTTGIGVKRRKLVYHAFRNLFSMASAKNLSWKEAYTEIEGKKSE